MPPLLLIEWDDYGQVSGVGRNGVCVICSLCLIFCLSLTNRG